MATTTTETWLAAEPPTASSVDGAGTGYQLTERDRDDYFSWRGNVAGLWRARRDAGAEGLPALRTMQRAFARQLTPAKHAVPESMSFRSGPCPRRLSRDRS